MDDEHFTVVGNIGQQPRRKTTPKGEVLEFSVAHSPRIRTAEGAWMDGETTWYRVTAWGRLGEHAGASLMKGQPVVVHGVLKRPEWTTADGTTHHGLDITAAAIGHDLTRAPARYGVGDPAAIAAIDRAAAVVLPAAAPAEQLVPAGAAAGPGWNPPLAAPPVQPPAPAGWTTGLPADEDAPF